MNRFVNGETSNEAKKFSIRTRIKIIRRKGR